MRTDSSGGPLFSVIIPTYNRPGQIPGLLDALAKQDLPRDEFEVILVDDGSATPIGPFSSVKVVTQQNQGCLAARMRGVGIARGRYLAFTDDDCRPAPDWLSRLRTIVVAHPDVAIAGPTINALIDNPFSAMTQEIVNHLTGGGTAQRFLDFAPTCNVTFPAARFRELKGFDLTWKVAGGEDRDLCARWRGMGYPILFDPNITVLHYHSLTLREYIRQHFNYGRGACMVRRKRYEMPPFGHLEFVRERIRGDRNPWTALGCFGIAQLATAAGFARERLSRALS